MTSVNGLKAQGVWQAASGVMGGGGAALGVKSSEGVHAGVRCARAGLVAGDGVVEQVLGEASGLMACSKLRLAHAIKLEPLNLLIYVFVLFDGVCVLQTSFGYAKQRALHAARHQTRSTCGTRDGHRTGFSATERGATCVQSSTVRCCGWCTACGVISAAVVSTTGSTTT